MGKRWSKEELEFLESYWGARSLSFISKQLNRSENAICHKAFQMDLGDPILAFDGISINELSKVLKVNYVIVLNWERKYGLPVMYKVFSKTKVRVISYSAFWKWAESNKQMIDFSRFEKNDIGPEPSWVDEKRKADHRRKFYKPKPHNEPWSNDEISKLKFYVEKGLTYPEICDQLKRSHGAVKRKLFELGVKYRPTYLDNHQPYKQNEVDYILTGLEKGLSIEEMARKLKRSEAGVRGKIERMGFKFKNGVPYKVSS